MRAPRSLRLSAAVLAAVLVVGCASRGAPELLLASSSGVGTLVPDCKNVAPDYRVEAFMVGSYLTTWDSALLEGTQEGIRRPLESPDAKGTEGSLFLTRLIKAQPGRAATVNRFLQSPAAKWRVRTNTLSKIPKPFCRRFDHRHGVVSLAAQKVLSSLKQYHLITNDLGWGMFETDFVEQHRLKVRWRDRFVVFVDSEGPESSVVRVFRDVYIDRSGNMFNQGVSVGRNEAYILTRIGDLLRR